MFAQNAAEEQKKSQSVYDAAGSDMPSRFPYEKGKRTASYPNGKEDVGGYMPVEIEQTPHQEKEWNRIGEQMLETAVPVDVRKFRTRPAVPSDILPVV